MKARVPEPELVRGETFGEPCGDDSHEDAFEEPVCEAIDEKEDS